MVSRRGLRAFSLAISRSATQTIDDESIPPLSSARTGASDWRRRLTASKKTRRNSSAYSASLWAEGRLRSSKVQYLEQNILSGVKVTKLPGATARTAL